MVIRIIAMIALVAGAASGQSVYRFSSNVSDLNPERDAFTVTTGTIRITADINNGAGPLDLSTANQPFTLNVKHLTDNWIQPIVSALDSTPTNGMIRWQFTLNPGVYELKSDLVFPDDTFPAFWRNLTVVALPSDVSVSITGITVNASVGVTNLITSSLNIYYWGTNVASITNSP